MDDNNQDIPLTDIMVERILSRKKELGLTTTQLCTSPSHDYPNISIDQYKSITMFKEGRQLNNNGGHYRKYIKPWMLEVLHENLRCNKNYLLGIYDEPNKDTDGKEYIMPLIFTNNYTEPEIRKCLADLGHKIASIDNQVEINILYYIFCQADSTTRKQIINELYTFVNEHKKMSYVAEKWQQSKSLQEKQAALSLIYNIAESDDTKRIIDCFFDAEVLYNRRNYYKSLIKYAKVIISYTHASQIKPYVFDSITRLQYIINCADDFNDAVTGLDLLSDEDRYKLISARFSKELNNLKTLLEPPLSKPTAEQCTTISFLEQLSNLED